MCFKNEPKQHGQCFYEFFSRATISSRLKLEIILQQAILIHSKCLYLLNSLSNTVWYTIKVTTLSTGSIVIISPYRNRKSERQTYVRWTNTLFHLTEYGALCTGLEHVWLPWPIAMWTTDWWQVLVGWFFVIQFSRQLVTQLSIYQYLPRNKTHTHRFNWKYLNSVGCLREFQNHACKCTNLTKYLTHYDVQWKAVKVVTIPAVDLINSERCINQLICSWTPTKFTNILLWPNFFTRIY